MNDNVPPQNTQENDYRPNLQYPQGPYIPQDTDDWQPQQVSQPSYDPRWGAHSAMPPQRKRLVQRPLFWVLIIIGIALVAAVLARTLLARVPDVSGMTVSEALSVIADASDSWQTTLEPEDADITVPVEVLERMFYADSSISDSLTVDHTDPQADDIRLRYDKNQQITLYVGGLKDLEEMRESALENAMRQAAGDSVASMDFEEDGMILVLNAHTADASYDMTGTDIEDFNSTFDPFCEEAAEATGSDVILRLYSSDGFLIGIATGANPQADDAERQTLVERAQSMTADADSYAHEHAEEYVQAFLDDWARTTGSNGGTDEWTADDSIIVRALSSYASTGWSGSDSEIAATRARCQAETNWMARVLRANVTIEYVNSGGDAWDTFVADCPAWPDFAQEANGADTSNASDATSGNDELGTAA